jgi:hypothetical protein
VLALLGGAGAESYTETVGTAAELVLVAGENCLPLMIGGSDEISCFISFSLGAQSFLKLTIGRPGASDTIVGVGSFGLRSFKLMLVALRISSSRISFPSFSLTSSSLGLGISKAVPGLAVVAV